MFGLVCLTVACVGGNIPQGTALEEPLPANQTNAPPALALSVRTLSPTQSSTSTLTPRLPSLTFAPSKTPAIQACAPFPGYTYQQLLAAINNPYRPPRWGSDDPHQGVDLAVKQGEMALPGGAVQAVLAGRVVAVIAGKFPYGNAVMLETRLDQLPFEWIEHFQLPTPAPTLPPHPSLTCPPPVAPLVSEPAQRSLYLLYAHLQAQPEVQMDAQVACGASLGTIGQSGNALVPHLHLEARLGPAGVQFNSMAHYSGGIQLAEMSSYCLWRVSGLFQLVDPLNVLAILP